MKRILTMILMAVSTLAMTACAGMDIGGLADPVVRVAETVTDENTSTKGATAGMSSSDAANVLINRDYYNAVKAIAGADKGSARPILEIESRDGKPIVIDAKSVKVYAPPAGGGSAQMALQAPREVESNGIKWFREVRRGLAEVFVPWTLIRENADTARLANTNATAVRQTELGVMNNAVTGSQDIAGQAITTYKPTIVTVPAAASGATETAPAE